MEQEKNKLKKIFEEEVWLYLSNELSEGRMEFWKKKLDENFELKQILEESLQILDLYNQNNQYDINEEKYNSIIDNIVAKKTLIQEINFKVSNFINRKNELQFGKIAFASILIIITIGISFLSKKETPLKKLSKEINDELLEWESKLFKDKLSNIETLIKITKDDDYRKYYKYNISSNNIEKNIDILNDKLKTLKKEINNHNL